MVYHALANWLHQHYRTELSEAAAQATVSPDFLVALAAKETGYLVERMLVLHWSATEILLSCVGDTLERRPSKFPCDERDLKNHSRGDEMFLVARRALGRVARVSGSYRAALSISSKFPRGYGLFQYDLQFFDNDRTFFLDEQWGDLTHCLARLESEIASARRRTLRRFPKHGVLTEIQVGIAYNRGTYNPSNGLRQGHRNKSTGLFYGEELSETLNDVRRMNLRWH